MTARELESLFKNTNCPDADFKIHRVDMKDTHAFVHLKGKGIKQTCRHMNENTTVRGQKINIKLDKELDKNLLNDKYQPSETLFVVNFPDMTRKEDLNLLFARYGSVNRITMHKNYSFIQYKDVNDAEDAQGKLDGFKFMGSHLTVRYASQRRYLRGHDEKIEENRSNSTISY
eukprot:UN27504